MNLRWPSIGSIFLLLSAAVGSFAETVVPTNDSTIEFLEKFVSYNQKQIKLAKTRSDLETRLFKFAQRGTKYGDDFVVEIQGITSTKTQMERIARYSQEVSERQKAIATAQEYLGRVERLQIVRPALVSQFLASKEARSVRINAKYCLASLDRMNEASKAIALNTETAERFADVRSRLATELMATSASPLATLTLLDATFECERTLLEAKFDSWIQPASVAHCFSAIALKQQEVSGPIVLDSHRSVRIMLDTNSLITPSAKSLKTYETGHEAELASYIMDQSTASVTPADIFRRSLTLARGDLYAALRMAFSVLRSNRTNLEFQRKLIDLRGDRASGGRNGGDWYHFFGAMLVRQIYWNWVVSMGLGSDNPSNDDKKKYTNQAGITTWEILVKDIKENRPSSELEQDLCRLDRQIGPRDLSISVDGFPSFMKPGRNRSTLK